MVSNRRKKKSTSNQISKPESSFTDLPPDLLSDILSRVSVKSIFIFRSLCKLLHSILTGHDSVKLHFSRASASVLFLKPDYAGSTASTALYLVELERDAPCRFCCNSQSAVKCSDKCSSSKYNDHVDMKLNASFMLPFNHLKKRISNKWSSWPSRFSVVNSCNGFLCLWSSLSRSHVDARKAMQNDRIVIYNPVTGEYSVIPLPRVDKNTLTRSLRVLRLGFCPETSEYKVLIHVRNRCIDPRGSKDYVTLIFTLGSGVWRCIENGPYLLKKCRESPGPVFLNGCLHWFLKPSSKFDTLICFNLIDEKFQILPRQTHLRDTCSLINFQDIVESINTELKGCLEFSSIKVFHDRLAVHYGCSTSYLCRFMLLGMAQEGKCFPKLFKPIMCLNNSGILMYDEGNALASFDGSNFRYFKIHGPPGLQAIRYVPSFCSLKEIMGEDAKVLNVRSWSASTSGKRRKVKPIILEERPLADE